MSTMFCSCPLHCHFRFQHSPINRTDDYEVTFKKKSTHEGIVCERGKSKQISDELMMFRYRVAERLHLSPHVSGSGGK